ncbi:MAG TPA: hypothetical protein VMP89_05920 [Solirubrobacteraceae bacterium]|nr:hypothetical protein [Solirubrobacteraceae bacterium]
MTERTCVWCDLPITDAEQRVWVTSFLPPRARARSMVESIAEGYAQVFRALSAPAEAQIEYHLHAGCWRELDAILRERQRA